MGGSNLGISSWSRRWEGALPGVPGLSAGRDRLGGGSTLISLCIPAELTRFRRKSNNIGNRQGEKMVADTVTRAQLSEAVYQEVGLSRNESAQLVESVLKEMADALARGDTVKISSFGSFFVRKKGQRMGRNPKTGEEVPIRPRKVLVFRASHVLKNRINQSLGEKTGA